MSNWNTFLASLLTYWLLFGVLKQIGYHFIFQSKAGLNTEYKSKLYVPVTKTTQLKQKFKFTDNNYGYR